MGSMETVDVTALATENDHVVPKSEPMDDTLTPESESSSPEPESAGTHNEGVPNSGEPAPIPKRKGGRKPIYATSEERKQRNRQAQAAFRERRTEYIKQLETTIQQHEDNLANLQQSHRTAADECLMLRYKNSLLERILLEKGIDVQAELRLKGSPHLGPIRNRNIGQSLPMQKAMMNRQQNAQRQRPQMAPPPIQTVNQPPRSNMMGETVNSPLTQPTPPSQRSSPSTTRSPGYPLGGMGSPTADMQPQRFPQQRQMQPIPQQFGQQQHRMHNRNQEYDAQVDMLDDVDGEDVDPDSFIPNFRLPPQTDGGAGMGMQASPPATATTASDAGNPLSSVPFDYDPMLDADPFGLSASMHFPNPYSGMPNHRR